MDQQRVILLVVFGFSLIMLWEGWQKFQQPAAPLPAVAAQAVPGASTPGASPAATAAPTPSTPLSAPGAQTPVPAPTAGLGAAAPAGATAQPAAQGEKVVVRTDTMLAEVSAVGGSIVHLEFLKHKATADDTHNFVLFDAAQPHVYLAESGLIGEGLPNHTTAYSVEPGPYELKEGADSVQVRLRAPEANGVEVTKVMTFRRGSYVVDVGYEIANQSEAPFAASAYFQLMRDGKPAESSSSMAQTFTGAAIYTQGEKYQKFTFSDIEKGKVKVPGRVQDGWIGMVQHYFVSAWLPQGQVEREFFAKKVSNDLYTAGVIVPVAAVAAGGAGKIEMPLYAGPQEQTNLEKLAPGLALVVDYGWLTVIAAPLFWLLEWIHKLVGNWGWAIILVTVLIKLAFFPLSAASYRSMAKMRVVTPKMAKIKEMYGNDKARMNQEMMLLYKKEKINPLGGCLPIAVQIPVFIALYWVLLGTVEMRHAPWMFWIHDLSSKDPYYVLPLIMGVSMLVQTKLNPTPPDPIQAKVMLAMPIIFTGMFLFFPSGLVLYWVVNNLLSIAQQWQITRMVEGAKRRAA